MLKFLRKYDKWILAVGGSLLMVAFLLPQALQQMGRGGMNSVVATYAYGEITAQQRVEANSSLQFVRTIVGPYAAQLGISEDPEHWIMLTEEARRAGFVGGPETGRYYFNEAARAQNVDPEEGWFAVIAGSGLSEDVALRALASFAGIDRLRFAHLQAKRVSEPELLGAYEGSLERVGLHAALVSASDLLPGISEFPPRERLDAFFEQHKDTPRGAGELDFGYRADAAVRFEWIEVSPADIQAAVPIDPVEVNARWRKNRELYTGEFADERPRIEDDMRRLEGAKLVGDMSTLVKSEMARAERDATEINLRELTNRIALRLSEREGRPVAPMAYDGRGERWLTLTDMQATPRVRNARYVSGQVNVSVPQMALNVAELNPSNPFGVRVGQIVGPLQSATGALMFARVTAVRPAGPPESIDDVIDRVREDYRLNEAWNTLLERAERFEAQMRVRGIATVAGDAGGRFIAGIRATQERLVPPVTREVDSAILARLNDPAFVSAVNSAAADIEPLGDVRETPLDNRVVVVRLPDKAAVALGEIIAVDAVRESGFRLGIQTAIGRLQQEWFLTVLGDNPFSFERMKERLGYESRGNTEDDFEDEATIDGSETG